MQNYIVMVKLASLVSFYTERYRLKKEGTHTGWFVHVDPCSVDVETGIGIVKHCELVRPIAGGCSLLATYTPRTASRVEIKGPLLRNIRMEPVLNFVVN